MGLLGHMADSLGARAALLRTLRGAHGRRCALMQVVCMQVGEVGYTDMRVAGVQDMSW